MIGLILVLLLIGGGIGGWLLYKRYAKPAATPVPVETAQVQQTPQTPPEPTPPPADAVPAPAPTPPEEPASATPATSVVPATQSKPAVRPTPGATAPRRASQRRGTQPGTSSFTPTTPSQPEQAPTPPPEPPPQVEQAPPPPVHTPVVTPQPTPARPLYSGPTSGVVLWTGKLAKNGLITIDGERASSGSVRGELPGVPVMVEMKLSDVAFAETPSPANGWKRMVLRSRVNRQMVVTVHWTVVR